MSETVKNIIKIILVVIVLAAQIFFGIKISDLGINLETTNTKIAKIENSTAILETVQLDSEGRLVQKQK